MKLINKDAVLAEIVELKTAIDIKLRSSNDSAYWKAQSLICERLEFKVNSLEVKEVDLENYNKVKKTLSLSFMNFLDANCQEGKMCLSNGECFDIDKAFDELDFAKLFRYMEKYLKPQKGKEV